MWIRMLMQSWRRLWRRPGNTVISVLVLGVGLGVVVFLFNLVDRAILHPLPVPQPDRLVVIGHAHDSGFGIGSLSNDVLLDLHGKLDGVGPLGAYASGRTVLGGGGHTPAAYEHGGLLTASALKMLGSHPLLGRAFVAADDAPGAPPVVLLSESLWRARYHADPHILGRSLRVDGVLAKVVGVMPGSFSFPNGARVWQPLHLRDSRHVQVIALTRLKQGATLVQLRQQLHALQPHLERVTRGANRARALTAISLGRAVVHDDTRRWVGLMFLAGLLVLLLACINVSSLQLVKALNRQHELALRSALGCSRKRLMFDALVDGCWLALGALLVAWLIFQHAGHWLAQTFVDNGRATEGAFIMPHMNLRMLGFMLLVAALSTTVSVLVPVWRVSRVDLQSVLGDGNRGSGAGFMRIARVMVVFEIALTVVLLVSAGTMLRTLRHLLSEPASTRVPAAQVLTAQLAFPSHTYRHSAQLVEYDRRIVQQLREDPEVEDASASNAIPDFAYGSDEYIAAQGQPRPPHGWTSAGLGIVDTHFLSTYGGRLLEGRFFNAHDDADSTPVAVIDRTTATRLWPGGDPLGQKLVLHPEASAEVLTVVGVIKPLRLSGQFVPPRPELLMPLRQAMHETPLQYVGLAVHTRAAKAQAYAQRLRREVQQVVSQAAVYRVGTQARLERVARVGVSVLVKFFGFLGLVALGLAAAGLYGVLAFVVSQRTREIGIRRAIGAGHVSIIRTISLQLFWQLGSGLAIGLALAWPWTSALASVGGLPMRVHDPLVTTIAACVVVVAAVLATLVPLVRALRVDPAVALRYE